MIQLSDFAFKSQLGSFSVRQISDTSQVKVAVGVPQNWIVGGRKIYSVNDL